jgi:predicted metal-binding membrane protein
MAGPSLEGVVQRDRAVILAALVMLTVLTWAYVVWLAGGMTVPDTSMSAIPSLFAWMEPMSSSWSALAALLVFAMWTVMMIGMMTPSAAPMILIYARVAREAAARRRPFAAVGWFLLGYLSVWTGFAAIATALQWALQRDALLSPALNVAGQRIEGVLLIVAGVYQWSPLKQACLRQCRAPLAFIQQRGGFRPGVRGALELGMAHGLYCLGCCWMLMVLLFVGGIMNVLCSVALAVLVLAEKVAPRGVLLSRVVGTALLLLGSYLLLQARSSASL